MKKININTKFRKLNFKKIAAMSLFFILMLFVNSCKKDRIVNQKEIHFYDNVTLERPQTRGGDSLRVDSDYMLALPNQDIVKTDKRVVIQLGTSRMEGTGMIADNGKHQMNLQSQVRGHYEPSH